MRLECFNPSILKTEPPPVTCAQSIWLPSFPLIRAAFSRGSGFVQWHVSDAPITIKRLGSLVLSGGAYEGREPAR